MSRKREVLHSKGVVESQTFTCPEVQEALREQMEAIKETDVRIRDFLKKARPVRLDQLVGSQLKAFRLRVVERLKDKGWTNKEIGELLEISPQVIQKEVGYLMSYRARRAEREMLKTAHRLLNHSFKPVGYKYQGLSPEEQELISEAEFEVLATRVREVT